ncbi:MAG: hypothetical protein ABSA93_27285 [Streptosporangiaceae bacterium]
MTHYQQSDSLSLAADSPLSGTGSFTPESAASDTDYAGWQWETILATVLGVAVPDRSALSGQEWLTITHDGATVPGAHQIWTAAWDTTPTSGAGSIAVYLNPALYTVGGAWNQFEQAPATALSGVPAGSYGTLQVQPSTFNAAGLALADVTDWFGSAAEELSGLARDASAPGSGISGSSAQVVAETFAKLATITLSLHDQMSSPVAYSNAIEQAGDAAARFLSNLWSAYSGWTAQPAYSPLGALVQLLEAIAEPGTGGQAVIADPQDTSYGDLTTDQAWATVEQQAKDLWLSLLTDGTAGFGGLDPLGHAALGGLVSQYDSAINALAPVVGPATPAVQRRTVGPGEATGGRGGPGGVGSHAGGTGPVDGGPNGTGGGANSGLFNVAAGPAVTGPAGGSPAGTGGSSDAPLFFAAGAAVGGGTAGSGPVAGGSTDGSSLATGAAGAGDPTDAPAAASLGSAGLGSAGLGSAALGSGSESANAPLAESAADTENLTVNSASLGALTSAATGAATGADGGAAAGAVTTGQPASELLSGAASSADGPVALSGAIGATGDTAAEDEVASLALAASTAFTGTIGKTGETPATSDRAAKTSTRKRAALAVLAIRQAPDAGSALGRSPDGSVLAQSAVPTLPGGPPSVRSGPVNTQLAPGGGTDGGASAGGLSGVPGGSTSPVSPAGSPASQSMTTSTTNPAGLLGNEGTGSLADGRMMPPGGLGGLGSQDRERQRVAYLPEEEEYWGTDPGAAPHISIGAPYGARPRLPDSTGRPEHIPGIGAIGNPAAEPDSRSDRR